MPLALSRRVPDDDEEKLVRMEIDDNGSPAGDQQKLSKYKRYMVALAIAIVVCVIIIIALAAALSKAGGGSPAASNAVSAELFSSISSAIDHSLNPCDDFYAYACGNWLANTPIPSDQSSWSRSFSVITESNRQTLKSIQEEDWPIIGNFYTSCMDMATINNTDIPPLVTEKLLSSLQLSVSDSSALAGFVGGLIPVFTPHGFFSAAVVTDTFNPLKNIIAFGQGGLSLPSKSYYSRATVVGNLSQHIQTMFALVNFPKYSPQAIAADSLALEMKLANISLDPDQLRDPIATYNNMTLATLLDLAPCFNFTAYLLASGFPAVSINNATVVTLESPSYFQNLCGILSPPTAVVSYLQWRILHSVATSMSQRFYDENFNFYGQKLQGQAAQTPRWKKCVVDSDDNLGELLGRYFVAQKFPGESKKIALDMIGNIESAFSKRVDQLTWMDDPTRQAANVKLKAVTALIGYPDRWTDYSSLNLCSMDYFGNLVQLYQFQQKQNIQKLSQKPDKFKWQMTPPTVNAYYDPGFNTINFPAGIMQGVFFNASFPSAVNYGALGMVDGHELTHGFDDQGAQFDGNGALHDWWTDPVKRNFQQRAQCLIDQYSQFQVNGEYVNGNLTLGENIADNGGIRLAFSAWKAHVAANGDEPAIDSTITNDQLFFLSFAQSWCQRVTPQRAHALIETDPHSPAKARVNLPLQNFEQFAATWNCPVSSYMNPANRCIVW